MAGFSLADACVSLAARGRRARPCSPVPLSSSSPCPAKLLLREICSNRGVRMTDIEADDARVDKDIEGRMLKSPEAEMLMKAHSRLAKAEFHFIFIVGCCEGNRVFAANVLEDCQTAGDIKIWDCCVRGIIPRLRDPLPRELLTWAPASSRWMRMQDSPQGPCSFCRISWETRKPLVGASVQLTSSATRRIRLSESVSAARS